MICSQLIVQARVHPLALVLMAEIHPNQHLLNKEKYGKYQLNTQNAENIVLS